MWRGKKSIGEIPAINQIIPLARLPKSSLVLTIKASAAVAKIRGKINTLKNGKAAKIEPFRFVKKKIVDIFSGILNVQAKYHAKLVRTSGPKEISYEPSLGIGNTKKRSTR